MKTYFEIRASFTLKARTHFDKCIAEKARELKYVFYKAHDTSTIDDYNRAIDNVGICESQLIYLLEEIIQQYQINNHKVLLDPPSH